MKRTLIAGVASALLLVGCSSGETGNDEPALDQTSGTTQSEPPTENVGEGVYPPGATVRSETYGIVMTITKVAQENTGREMPMVFTFELVNDSDKVFADYNWPTPEVSYGAKGLPARSVYDINSDLSTGVSGAIPPGGARTVRHGYELPIDELDDVTMSIGSIIYRGDFTSLLDAEAEQSSSAPALPAPAESAPSVEAPAADGPPNPYPNSQDSYGRDTGTSGATFVECADPNMYQQGTGVFSDGSMDYAPQCAG